MAQTIIAQVNPRAPRTHGDGRVHVSQISKAVHVDTSLALEHAPQILDTHHRIGAHVASLVEDGACLQAGIGVVPDACLLALRGHKDLGCHTGAGLLPPGGMKGRRLLTGFRCPQPAPAAGGAGGRGGRTAQYGRRVVTPRLAVSVCVRPPPRAQRRGHLLHSACGAPSPRVTCCVSESHCD
mmetsp:Transcript_9898/g.25600  ORF Transcript_9898/g.25600 Transcript_9898/m.25600 type:complete len:182 (-) Transcript_9898:668-1213(-)